MNTKDKLAFMEVQNRTFLKLPEPVPNFAVYRVEGTATNEFTRTGKCRPVNEYTTLKVVAFEVRDPNGFVWRFAHRHEALSFAKAAATVRNLQERGVAAGHYLTMALTEAKA